MFQGDANHVDSADRGPAPAEFFEILVATRSAPIRIEYAAIRSLRSVMAAEGQSVGLLLGTRSPEALSVDRCQLLPQEAASLEGFVKAYAEHPASHVVGFFRTQPAGWPEMQKADRDIAQRCFRHPGSLFLLIQTPARRPWSAALFDLDLEATSPAKKPSLEFFFDEYLLRNGYSTGLVPAPEQQELPDDPPLKSKRNLWIALGALAALILLGALGYLWLGDKNRTESASIATSSPLALKVVRSGNDFEVSWDRLAPALQQASGGSVTIRDGEITRTVTLSASQLREGRILYAPLFGDLNFRLEIQQGARSQAESVQVLSWDHPGADLANLQTPQSAPLVPPLPAQHDSPLQPSSGRSAADTRLNSTNIAPASVLSTAPALVTPNARAKVNEPAPITPARAPIASPAPDKPPADRSVSPAKPIAVAATPPPVAAPTVQPAPAAKSIVVSGTPPLPAPTSAVASEPSKGPPLSAAKPVVPPSPVAPPPAPATIPSAAPLPSAAPAAAAKNGDSVSSPLPTPGRSQSPGNFVPPTPVKRASPNITPALKRAVESRGGHVNLSVRVTVDAHGKVRNAEALAPEGKATFADSLLRSAALDAARLWTFSPGKRNGNAAEGDFIIDFVFQ